MTHFCQLCGQRIRGEAFLYRHASWQQGGYLRVCQQCHLEARRCQICQIPLAASSDQTICPTCATRLPRCSLCNQLVIGEYLNVPERGIFCQNCVALRAACDVCGAPVANGGQMLSDGRRICGQCHATAVYDMPAALTVYEQVQAITSHTLGLTLNVPTVLVLLGRDQLHSLLQEANHSSDNVTHLLGIYLRRGRKRAIYAQSGLPRLLLMQVIAHEWGHAWQMENAPLLETPQAIEGFAEWVAYKNMEIVGARQALARMANRSDLYGQGLRAVLAIEAECGTQGVLAWCRQAR